MSCRLIGKIVLLAVGVLMANAAARSTNAQTTKNSDGGYIDNAVITNMFRVRTDAGWNLNRPDRAEYFYASWAELTNHPHPIKNTDAILPAPHNRGPLNAPQYVNYQDISTYLELKCSDRLSVFGDLPFRIVQFKGNLETKEEDESPDFNEREENSPQNPQGISDTILGLKYAWINDPDLFFTFQSRTFIPTGNPVFGLGTGHYSTENGMLLYKRLTDEMFLLGEAKIWIPISGGSNAGNIAIYGSGLTYNVYQKEDVRVTPVVEWVGWTVLNGFETIGAPVPNTARRPDTGLPATKTHGVEDATGNTIVNIKLGVRTYFSAVDDVYVGWGHAVTGNRWYQDVLRIEYRRSF